MTRRLQSDSSPSRVLRGFFAIACSLSLALSGCSTAATPASPGTTPANTTVTPGRGIWLWDGATVSTHKASSIVNTPSLQAQTIANLKAWNVTMVYGSYSSVIVSNPAGLRAWNQLLAQNGIQSYYLISSTNYFLPEDWAAAQSEIETNVLDFNAGSATGQGFTGLALDVEPDSFAGTTGTNTRTSWSAATTAVRRTYLTYFLDFLQSTRSLLNQNGASSMPVQTALAYWYVQQGATIGWASQSDTNAWFASLGQVVNRVSIMDYFTDTQSLIQSRYTQNSTILPTGGSTIALRYLTGAEWTSLAEFWTSIQTSESTNSINDDLEDYDTVAVAEGV